jgi:hypothetical protein
MSEPNSLGANTEPNKATGVTLRDVSFFGAGFLLVLSNSEWLPIFPDPVERM